MADLNEVRLIGRLTRDPEQRSTPSGQTLCSFGLAISKRYKDQSGQQREETIFVDVTAWSRLAEIVSQYCRKGAMIYLGGRLKFDTWEDRQTGQKRSKLSVVADNIQFLEKRQESAPQQGYQAPPAYQAQQGNYLDEPPF